MTHKAYAQIVECCKAQDTITQLVSLREYAKKWYHIAKQYNDAENMTWYSAMYHAAKNEIIRRYRTGRY